MCSHIQKSFPVVFVGCIMQGACKMSSGITTAQLYIPKARKPVESPEAGRLRQNETGKDIHCQRIRKNEGDSKTAQF